MMEGRNCPRTGAVALLLAGLAHSAWSQQLDESCTVSVLNRSVRVNPDGSWVLPNIPANFGKVRARVTCVIDGRTVTGESEPFEVVAGQGLNVPRITLGETRPIPTELTITARAQTLTTVGGSMPLAVSGHYSDGTTRDLTAGSTGTGYTSSNTRIAQVSPDGLVTAMSSGTALIQATHEGASGILA